MVEVHLLKENSIRLMKLTLIECTRLSFDSYYFHDKSYSSKVELYTACVSLNLRASNISLCL